MSQSLNDVGTTTGTDKASFYIRQTGERRPGHNYLAHYERHLAPLRDVAFTLLELGIGHFHNSGGSLKLWDKYFTHPNAKIVGVDIGAYNRKHEGGRVAVEIGDCSDSDYLKGLASKYQPRVIIDDASHMWAHQITAFQALFPTLPSGGVYILEDIHTSFGDPREEYRSGDQDAYQFAARIMASFVGRGGEHPSLANGPDDVWTSISWIECLPRAVIFVKK